MSEAEVDEFEALLDLVDRDILAWLTGEAPTPDKINTPLWKKLEQFHTHGGPINV